MACNCKADQCKNSRSESVAKFSTHHPFKRILVAIDDGEPSQAAIAVAVGLATALGSELKFVHVINTTSSVAPEYMYIPEINFRAVRAQATEILRRAQRQVPHGVQHAREILEGLPAEEILRAARQWDAELIVIGTHGRGPLSSMILGNTAQAISRHASCPVMSVGQHHVDRIRNFLNSRQARYTVVAHPRKQSAFETVRSTNLLPQIFAKTLLVKLDENFALVTIPADRELDLEMLKRSTNAHTAELADEHDLKQLFPDCEIGAMPPLGDLYGLDVYVDVHLARQGVICFNAGTHDELIEMEFKEFERLARIILVEVSEQPANAFVQL